MKNKKRILALAIALATTFTATPQVASADTVDDIITELEARGIVISEIDKTTPDPTTIQFEGTNKDQYNQAVNVDFSTGEGVNRNLTGIVTNGDDNASAATVAYVTTQVNNGVTNAVNQSKTYTDQQVAAGVTNAVNQSKTYTDQRFDQSKAYTDQKFDDAKEYTNGVGAMAAAMASIPAPPQGGAGTAGWGIAAGVYHGKTAVAAGLHYDISDTVRAQAKVAMQGSENMVGVGLGGTFGAPKKKEPIVNRNIDDGRLQELMRRIAALEKERANGSLYTTTSNYTNMYGHNFVVKQGADGIEMLNLDGTPMTESQLRKFAEDFAYNNEGREFDYTNFQKNNAGNWQYLDPEVGWLPGSEQAAVGTETIERTSSESRRATGGSDGEESLRSRINKLNSGNSTSTVVELE